MEKTGKKHEKQPRPELQFPEHSAYGVQKAIEADLHAKARAFGIPGQDLILGADDVLNKDDGEDRVERMVKKFEMGKRQAKS